MSTKSFILLLLIILPLRYCQAQTDSVLQQLQKIPIKYLEETEKKVEKYSNRLTNKTEKTLVKLSRWEDKIHTLLQKANPDAANRLFASNQLTFKSALIKYQQGKSVTEGYKARYDQYRDEMTTRIKYLENKKEFLDKKYLAPLAESKEKIASLEVGIQNTEAIQQFIKERRKQLLQEAMKYLGKNKYLTKINKESYYYLETIQNYKEIFSDNKKTEKVAMELLNKIPAFKKFFKENNALASILGRPTGSGSAINLSGLQTRVTLNNLIQNQISAGGPNAREAFSKQMQLAQAELSKLKDKIEKAGGNRSGELPDFKPNNQKTKIFKQRIEYAFDMQPQKGTSYIPGALNIGANLGYKLNDKSLIGIGSSYKIGLGSLQKIRLSNQGFGLRTFLDWKLKKQFYISSGYEINQVIIEPNTTLNSNLINKWQPSGLLGISKKYKVGKGRNGKIQVLWNFLSYQQVPISQPIIFRFGIPIK